MEKVRVQPQSRIDTVKIQQSTKHQILEPCKELFVHALTKPLCQRFLNYETPVISFNKDNKIEKLYSSTPIKNTLNPMFKNIASNTDLSFEDLRKHGKEGSEVPVPSFPEKGSKLKECELKDDSDKADLRHVIQAKKRSLCLEPNSNTEKIESK